MQKERLEYGGLAIVESRGEKQVNPGVERKHRRVSLDKSMVNEDEHVDIDLNDKLNLCFRS